MPPTATADPVDTALQTPEAADVFVSRREDLRLVKKAIQDRYNASGERIERLEGEVIRFREGRFTLPRTGTIRLEDGRKAKVDGIRTFLEEHPLNGDVEEGFWAMPTVTPAPSSGEIEGLLRLVQNADADGLRAFINGEEAGYARNELLASARAALERLENGPPAE